jgi:class 3 adenylate cyclase
MPSAHAAPRQGLRLFHKIFLVTLAIGLLPLAGLAIAVYDTNAAALRYSTRQLHLAIATDAVRAVRAQLGAARTELLGIGQLLLAPGLGDDARRLALASSKVTSSDAIDVAAVYSPAGTLIVAIKAKEAQPALPLPRQLEPRLLERLKAGQLTSSEVIQGPALPVFLPIEIDGQRLGILATALDLNGLCGTLRELGERRLSNPDGVFVVDGQLSLVAASVPARVERRESMAGQGPFSAISGSAAVRPEIGAALEFSHGGVEMLGALEAVPELDWAVVVEQPRALAYYSLTVLRRSIAAAALLAALLAALSGWLLAQRLARPIAELEAATARIAARDYVQLPPWVSARTDELGSLGRAFDKMSGDLQVSEAKVVEETAARTSLSRYLSADVVEAILHDPTKLALGGERREVTVLFADVVAFTRLAVQQPPEIVVALLNDLFTIATEIIHRRGGIVDKFIGDCVMAVWGAPQSHPDDARRAVQAAEDLRRWLDSANRKWRNQFGLEIRLAMGVNTGQAVAGNLGSEKRMDYTVVGDAVNVAAKLEALAAPGQILVSQATRDKIPELGGLRPIAEGPVKARGLSVPVFEVVE